ncbi:uncharacterized protein LOC133889471, partial [Phragmites australis]|uniref:uncharacterized protein LOC133889471 n=1 Tax=Phragmites australis TaxID=29695 RepID=UPI002D778CBB
MPGWHDEPPTGLRHGTKARCSRTGMDLAPILTEGQRDRQDERGDTKRMPPWPRPYTVGRPMPRPPRPSAAPPWPYSAKHHDTVPSQRHRSSALASCLAAVAFLLLSAGRADAALFLLFRPRPPGIVVAVVRLPSFAAANGTVAFTFEQTTVVLKLNRSRRVQWLSGNPPP